MNSKLLTFFRILINNVIGIILQMIVFGAANSGMSSVSLFGGNEILLFGGQYVAIGTLIGFSKWRYSPRKNISGNMLYYTLSILSLIITTITLALWASFVLAMIVVLSIVAILFVISYYGT